MSLGALLCNGIGPGSTIALLLTEGLGAGSSPPAPVSESHGGYLPPRRRKPDWRERDERSEELAEEIRAIYERVVEGKSPAPEITRALKDTVAPFVAHPIGRKLPQAQRVDFQALAANVDALDRMLSALARTREAEAAKRAAEDAEFLEVIEMLVEQDLI